MDPFIKMFGFNENFMYKNELETMLLFEPSNVRSYLANAKSQILLNKIPDNNFRMKSANLRQEGNRLFKESPTKNALAAAKYYTMAIFFAELGSEDLALAHANRAMALQQFGYYSQAYDDSTCALELGYPIPMQHKIIIRQGHCALNLGDVTLLTKHLDTLNDFKLNDNFAAELQKLQIGLDELQLSNENIKCLEHQGSLDRNKVKISKSSTKGRFMVATNNIETSELVFSDRATSFLPMEKWRVCQQCAATQLIPFPCYRCDGKVVYCSVKCRKTHETTHAYECMAYQLDIFPGSGESHLALRVILDGIQQVIPFLRSKRTAKEIWFELTDENSELLQNHLEYVEVLRRVTHLEKNKKSLIMRQATCSGITLEYLKTFTKFFNIFDDTAATRSDWELVIGSLILRHIGQNSVNVIHGGLIKNSPENNSLYFELMDDTLWDQPLHIRRGYLHQKLENINLAFTANYSYLGVMNNSCEPSIRIKSAGRYLSAFAVKEINSSEEISLRYINEDIPQKSIRKKLQEKFHFQCDCSKCTTKDNDDYSKYNRYRCEYSECRSVFTPIVSDESLNWWLCEDGANRIRCSKCNNLQPNLVKAVVKIQNLLELVESTNSRNKLFKSYKDFDLWLLDNHQLKCVFAQQIVEKCFAAYNDGTRLTNKDFLTLVHICKYSMSFGKNITYAQSVAYLWDIIAIKKYQYNPEEMQEMLKGIEAALKDYTTQTVYMNYYNDYIATGQ